MDYERAYGWKGNTFNESEMALFSECMLQCARKVLDTADIVREACFRKLTNGYSLPPGTGFLTSSDSGFEPSAFYGVNSKATPAP